MTAIQFKEQATLPVEDITNNYNWERVAYLIHLSRKLDEAKRKRKRGH